MWKSLHKYNRSQKWLASPILPVFMPFAMSLAVLTEFESELGCVTHFEQWDISKCHANKGWKSTCTTVLVCSCTCAISMRMLRLAAGDWVEMSNSKHSSCRQPRSSFSQLTPPGIWTTSAKSSGAAKSAPSYLQPWEQHMLAREYHWHLWFLVRQHYCGGR